MMRQLINRRGRESIAGANVPEQIPLMGQHTVVVYRWIPEIGANGVHAVLLDGRRQRGRCQVKRLTPLDFDVLEHPGLRANAL